MLPALETLTEESRPPMERMIDDTDDPECVFKGPDGVLYRRSYVRKPEDDYSVVMESYEK